MLRNRLEETIWAMRYVLKLDSGMKGAYNRAREKAKYAGHTGAKLREVADHLWRDEELDAAREAAEFADVAVLMLRKHEISNFEYPGSIHMLDMSKCMADQDNELDYDYVEKVEK